jgi:hypothetical protein
MPSNCSPGSPSDSFTPRFLRNEQVCSVVLRRQSNEFLVNFFALTLLSRF